MSHVNIIALAKVLIIVLNVKMGMSKMKMRDAKVS